MWEEQQHLRSWKQKSAEMCCYFRLSPASLYPVYKKFFGWTSGMITDYTNDMPPNFAGWEQKYGKKLDEEKRRVKATTVEAAHARAPRAF